MASEIIVEFPTPLTDKEKKMIYGYKGEVVRCEDCKHHSLNRKIGNACCDLGIGLYQLDDYCSRGERREDGNID